MNKVVICLNDNADSMPQLRYAIDFCKHFNRDFELILMDEENQETQANDSTYFKSAISPKMRLANSQRFHDDVKLLLPAGTSFILSDDSYDLLDYLRNKYLRNNFSLLMLPHSHKGRRWPFANSLSQFIKKLEAPIFLIGEQADFQPFSHIVYASSFLLSDVTVLNLFQKIYDNMIKEIDVIHVASSEGFNENLLTKEFENYIRTNLPHLTIRMHNIAATKSQETITEAFLTALSQFTPDLLIMMKENKSGIEELLTKSFTSAVAKEVDIPILVLHEPKHKKVNK